MAASSAPGGRGGARRPPAAGRRCRPVPPLCLRARGRFAGSGGAGGRRGRPPRSGLARAAACAHRERPPGPAAGRVCPRPPRRAVREAPCPGRERRVRGHRGRDARVSPAAPGVSPARAAAAPRGAGRRLRRLLWGRPAARERGRCLAGRPWAFLRRARRAPRGAAALGWRG